MLAILIIAFAVVLSVATHSYLPVLIVLGVLIAVSLVLTATAASLGYRRYRRISTRVRRGF